jgi:dTDP-glucose pyrophosphorylase
MKINLKWKRAVISINNSIKYAIRKLDFAEVQILMIVSKNNKFVGTITDGDVRRGLIRGNNLEDKLEKIVNFKPIVAPPGTDINSVKEIMSINSINQLPIIDKNKKIQGLHILKDFIKSKDISSPLVIMAGGKGIRLRPLTKHCPKPMLKIKGKPILEWIVLNAKKQGFKNIFIITNYLSNIIVDYFKKNKFGINVTIIKENKYCGTIGGLYLLKKKIKNDFVLTNGDIISDIKFDDILEFHKSSSTDATMAVQPYFNEIPFGVVKTEGQNIKDIIEKPSQKNYVNAGVYVIKSELIKNLKNEHLNVTDFFKKLIKKKKKITAFALHEDWSDIGIKKTYEEFNQS